MIGTTAKRGGESFTIVGADGGDWVLQPSAHGPSFTVTPRELRADYKVKTTEAPAEGDAQTGWDRLSAAFWRAAARRGRAPLPPTPEALLRSTDAAKAYAAKIVADEELTADYEAGYLNVSQQAAAEIDALLNRGN